MRITKLDRPLWKAATPWALTLAALLLILPGMIGCGDESGPKMSGAGPPPPSGPAKKPVTAAAPTTIQRVMPPTWDPIKPYFEKFANQPVTTQKDVFRDSLVKHVPRVDLPPPPSLEPESKPVVASVVEDVEVGPLQRYPARDYKLVMILSGTVVPKAVVVDPIGNSWIIQRDTRLGNGNGIVTNITQYSVIVQEPENELPLEKTIKPPIFELASDLSTVMGEGEARLTAPMR